MEPPTNSARIRVSTQKAKETEEALWQAKCDNKPPTKAAMIIYNYPAAK